MLHLQDRITRIQISQREVLICQAFHLELAEVLLIKLFKNMINLEEIGIFQDLALIQSPVYFQTAAKTNASLSKAEESQCKT